jgi:hypothetical protein
MSNAAEPTIDGTADSYGISYLVFITETDCVYCAVRAGFLNVTHVALSV